MGFKVNDYLRDQLNLHFIVFIWGFTAILGRYISLDAFDLVFNRTAITAVVIAIYLLIKKRPFKAPRKNLLQMAVFGMLIGLHWITFFGSIKLANVSIALAGISTGALFSAILKPIFKAGRLDVLELSLGALVIFGIAIIFYEEPDAGFIKSYSYAGFTLTNYQLGLIVALISAMLSAAFSLFNSRLVSTYSYPVQITFWEMTFAFAGLFVFDFIAGSHEPWNLWAQTSSDWMYLLILSLLCTAYPFIKSVELLKRLTPFSVMLAINLEPVYGIILAALLFGAQESMNAQFYFGLLIILGTVVANGIIKAQKRKSLS